MGMMLGGQLFQIDPRSSKCPTRHPMGKDTAHADIKIP